MTQLTVTLSINGNEVTAESPAHYTLLRWVRENAQAYEVKDGCSEGVCGACTVLVDGLSATACSILAAQVNGSSIETAAGLADSEHNLNPLQEAFWQTGASQCGFCTQGILMVATEMLRSGERFDHHEIREQLHGNLCRCSGYQSIVNAVERALSGSDVSE